MADAAYERLMKNLKKLDASPHSSDKIKELLKDLEKFKDILDIDDKNVQESILKEFGSRVHKAEDVVDNFVSQKSISKTRNGFGKAIQRVASPFTFRELTREIDFISKTVNNFVVLYSGAPLRVQLPDKGAAWREPPLVDDDNVIGFDEEAQTVIERLIGDNQDLDNITIMGMPGLGKTILAGKVYHTQAIKAKFLKRAWAYVSHAYKKKELYISILSQINSSTSDEVTPNYKDMSVEAIVNKVSDVLKEERYLIVMDDVRTREAWDDLIDAFPKNKKGSRILITSQHKEVGCYANPEKEPHCLKSLTVTESWELLEKKIFGKEKCPPGKLQMLGNNIATECEGLPLAIMVIADILSTNRESCELWEQVANNVNLFVVTDQKQFMRVRELSYNQLPQHMKSCFLYLSVFREDKIPVGKLTRLWIAEGFIEEKEDKSLEAIAEECLNELINRNFLLAKHRDFDGRIKTRLAHKTLHYFCKEEAQQQNFYYTINEDHRIPVPSNMMRYIYSKAFGEQVHSLLCLSPEDIVVHPEASWKIPKAFKSLRVLDIESIIFQVFSEEILQLVHLRYISMSCNIKSLPSRISKLLNLQTLIIMTKLPTLELKNVMWSINQLRHLRTNASAVLSLPPPNATKCGENLKSLSMISPESCTYEVFKWTPSIKKLGVRGNLVIHIDNLFKSVVKLQNHLTNLKLFNYQGQLPRLPSQVQDLINLKKLTLSNTSLEWEHMKLIGTLEKLEVLKLKDNAFTGEYWGTKDGGFRFLKFLHIGKTDLNNWSSSKDHFPSLKGLFLRHCDKLQAVPSGFADVTSFQELELCHTNKKVVASGRVIEKKKTSCVFKLTVHPPDM